MPNDPRRAEELRHLEQVKLNARVAEWEHKGAGWMEYLKEVAAKFGMTWEAVRLFLDNHYREEDIPKDPIERERALLYLRKNEEVGKPPGWVQVSGLWASSEPALSIIERRQRLQNLYRATKTIMREAIGVKYKGLVGAEEERTIYWDPVAEVCKALEVSQSKLTQLIKEHSGSNLPQLADEIRGEAVQRKMRAEVRERVLKARGMGPMGRMGQMGPMKKGCCEGCGKALTREGGTTNDEEIGELGATFSRKCWEVWRALKATRKEPEFSREIWALGYGFATYRRMYRACKVVYEMTPQQLEMSLIEEALRKTRENEGKDGEWDVFYAKWKGLKKEFKEWTPEELDKASRSIKTWDAIEAEAREKRNSKCKMENAK